MSEFRVVEANGDPYPPHAAPCRDLAQAIRRRDFYSKILSVSGEARMPERPLRIERRSMVVSMWEPWNVGAAPGVETERKGAVEPERTTGEGE